MYRRATAKALPGPTAHATCRGSLALDEGAAALRTVRHVERQRRRRREEVALAEGHLHVSKGLKFLFLFDAFGNHLRLDPLRQQHQALQQPALDRRQMAVAHERDVELEEVRL